MLRTFCILFFMTKVNAIESVDYVFNVKRYFKLETKGKKTHSPHLKVKHNSSHDLQFYHPTRNIFYGQCATQPQSSLPSAPITLDQSGVLNLIKLQKINCQQFQWWISFTIHNFPVLFLPSQVDDSNHRYNDKNNGNHWSASKSQSQKKIYTVVI